MRVSPVPCAGLGHGTALVNTVTMHLPSDAHNFVPERWQKNERAIASRRGLANDAGEPAAAGFTMRLGHAAAWTAGVGGFLLASEAGGRSGW